MDGGRFNVQAISLERLADKANQVLALVGDDAFPLSADLTRHDDLRDALEDVQALSVSVSYYFLMPRDTFYVAFIGHYSAGKSSTVNSLFNADREVEVNPTDTKLTFVSSAPNTDPIRQTLANAPSKVANFVDVQTVTAKHSEDMVLIDTPGGGDPRIERNLIQNFLPVCDAIAYFTTGAAPFDASDQDVLSRYMDDLNFIPMFFVVTRADEFRRDKARPLTAENYDQNRADRAISTAKTRLKEDFDLPTLEDAPHVVIDNVAKFGIEHLRESLGELKTRHASREPEIVAYFDRRLTGSISVVLGHLDHLRGLGRKLEAQLEEDRSELSRRARERLDDIAPLAAENQRAVASAAEDFNVIWGEALAELETDPKGEAAAAPDADAELQRRHATCLSLGEFFVDRLASHYAAAINERMTGYLNARNLEKEKLTEALEFEPIFERMLGEVKDVVRKKFGPQFEIFINALREYEKADFDRMNAEIERRGRKNAEMHAALRTLAGSIALREVDETAVSRLTNAVDGVISDLASLAELQQTRLATVHARFAEAGAAQASLLSGFDALTMDASALAPLRRDCAPKIGEEGTARLDALAGSEKDVLGIAEPESADDAALPALTTPELRSLIAPLLNAFIESIAADITERAKAKLEGVRRSALDLENDIASQARAVYETTIADARRGFLGWVSGLVGIGGKKVQAQAEAAATAVRVNRRRAFIALPLEKGPSYAPGREASTRLRPAIETLADELLASARAHRDAAYRARLKKISEKRDELRTTALEFKTKWRAAYDDIAQRHQSTDDFAERLEKVVAEIDAMASAERRRLLAERQNDFDLAHERMSEIQEMR